MRITIQVTCESPEDAQEAIARLTRPRTWVDDVEATRVKAGLPPLKEDSGISTTMLTGPHPSTTEPRPNVSPGWVACSRIGADTKEELLKGLPGRSDDTAHIGKKIKRNEEQTKALIQLLWDRGEIKFDGVEFYL